MKKLLLSILLFLSTPLVAGDLPDIEASHVCRSRSKRNHVLALGNDVKVANDGILNPFFD